LIVLTLLARVSSLVPP